MPRVNCHSYTLSIVKEGKNGERYYFVANLSTDIVDKINIGGKELECQLSTYGSIIVREENGNLEPIL